MKSSILEKIYGATLKFLPFATVEETYAAIVREAVKLVGGDGGRMVLEEDGEFVLVYATDPVARIPHIIRKKGFVYKAFSEHKAFLVDREEQGKIYPEKVALGVECALFIPMSYRGKSIGVLVVESYKPGCFSLEELNTLKMFGAFASLKVKNVQLYDEMKKALENRDLFISLAAHELRTPVTTIFGYSQLLYEKTKNEDSSEARWISSLHAESYRLTLLIKDLLEINRIKNGTLNYTFKGCHLKEVIGRAIDGFKFNYDGRKVVFNDYLKMEGDLIVGDFDKILQVVLNLLDNAAKFSSDETTIVISAKFRSPNFILQVKDQGKGIPKKDLPKVFQGFYKGKDSLNEGMGLGLFLCKSIIEAHRGTIHLHSRVGKGTLVEVQLPRANL